MQNNPLANLQGSSDSFDVINMTGTEMSGRFQANDYSIIALRKSMGKIVSFNEAGAKIKYGTGCLIAPNVVIIPVNMLYCEKTNRNYPEIYFIPYEVMQNEKDCKNVDFINMRNKIRISNYYVDSQYFDKLDDQGRTPNVFDVAICELNHEDVQNAGFKQQCYVDIGFNYNGKLQDEVILFHYSENDSMQRDILQEFETKIVQVDINQKVIQYRFKIQNEQRQHHEDAFIFRLRNGSEQKGYELIGIHKGVNGEKSYGFLLQEFLRNKDWLIENLKKRDKIDFDLLLKHSYNKLFQLMLENREKHEQQREKLNNQLKDITKMADYFMQEKQKLEGEKERLLNKIQSLEKNGPMRNIQAVNMKNEKIRQLTTKNEELNGTVLILRQKIVELQKCFKDYKAQKEQQFEQRNKHYTTILQLNDKLSALHMTIDILNGDLSTYKDKQKMLITVIDQMRKKSEEFKRQMDELRIQNINLIEQKNSNVTLIAHLKEENKQLLDQNALQLRMMRNPLLIPSNRELFSPSPKRRDFASLNQWRHEKGILLRPQRANQRQIQERPQPQRLFSTVVTQINHQQPHRNLEANLERPVNFYMTENRTSLRELEVEQLQRCNIFRNFFTVYSHRLGCESLKKKVLQIQGIYEEEVRKVYSMGKSIKYVQDVYQNNGVVAKERYFKNTDKRIEETLEKQKIVLTKKGYNLHLRKVKWDVGTFFRYDWLDLEFLLITEAEVTSQMWKEFCSYAQVFLPKLKALFIEFSQEVDVRKEDLMNFWSIEKIWFGLRGEDRLSQESRQEIEEFKKSKKQYEQVDVEVVFKLMG